MRWIILGLLAFAPPAVAKEHMVILNDLERDAMRELLDVAVRASGLQGNAARNAVILLDKINAAPEVVERKEETPEVPK